MARALPRVPLDKVRTISIRERRHLVSVDRFARAVEPAASVEAFLDALPRFLAADELRALAQAIAKARAASRPVVFAIGGHVVKVGLAPLLIDLMERGVVTAVAMNGSAAIHDFEIALAGETSEDVADTIRDGRFGMVRESAEAFARATRRGAEEGIGLGRALGLLIEEEALPHRAVSLLAAGARLGLPSTVHAAIGTDVVHQCPGQSGALMGESSYIDFQVLGAVVCDLEDGVWVNVGSAVFMPEVFLKLVSVARNLGYPLERVTAADLDMIQHYRPRANLLSRPVARGIAITGHHEILVPLLRAAVLSALARAGVSPRRPEPEEEA